MGQPYNLRQGWQSENLARYLLSKIAFVSQPVTISDDTGVDFFCTLFEIGEGKGQKSLLPKSSFAIQVKSKVETDEFEITAKEEYIRRLEVPFFWGIVDKKLQKIEIYSGEYFELFISHKGGVPKGNKLFIKLTEERNGKEPYYNSGNKHYIKFPKVIEIDSKFDYLAYPEEKASLSKTCELMLKNIAARIRKSNIFEMYNGTHTIFIGPYSVTVFRENVYKALTEAFHNLARLIKDGETSANEEFKAYKTFFEELKRLKKDLPAYLVNSFKKSRSMIDKKTPKT